MSEERLEPKKPKIWPTGSRDNPEQYPTENQSLFDMYESERNVDPIPVEDVKMEQHEEQDKDATKHRSSSEEKYESAEDM
ncbi:hypothetical protein E5161_16595 [Cohnella pontilimi]|uniref:Uncharacterized protein n=1 Tax=Cohnella pontilimi TaxID=2564100 RepID=A0A4U0F9K1_9BACL|nr:hypothetical protein [Cohnella pontilimi]TJY40764.1 hypothetical protein E5161_16595 [Cohnella pontilimi]